MDVRRFGNFLLTLAAGLFVWSYCLYQVGLAGSDERQSLLSIIYNDLSSISQKREARSTLDDFYADDAKRKTNTYYLLIAGGVVLTFGIGLLIAAKPEKKLSPTLQTGRHGEIASMAKNNGIEKSVVEQLTELSQLKDAGHLTASEFEIAKTKLLM